MSQRSELITTPSAGNGRVYIPSGTALSVVATPTGTAPGLSLAGTFLFAVGMPAAWDAAALTFQASPDGVTWSDVWQSGAELSFTVAAAGRLISGINLRALFLRLRSGTSGTPVNQTADRILNLQLVSVQ